MQERWLLFTGLVRTPDTFIRKLALAERWLAEGRIQGLVFSTWLGELAQYPQIRGRLLELGAVLVEQDPPNIRTPGSVLHQMVSLRTGLRVIPPGALVLKTRCDLANLTDGDAAIFAAGLPPTTEPPGWPRVFSHKVAITGTFMFNPFYANDIHFFGVREDLMRLVSFDLWPEFCSAQTGPEQWFHWSPFRQHFPVFQRYFEVQPGLIFNRPEQAQAVCMAALRHDLPRHAMATWFAILQAYYVFQDDLMAPAPAPVQGMTFDALFQPGAPGGLSLHDTANHPTARRSWPFEAFLENRVRFRDGVPGFAGMMPRVHDFAAQQVFSDAATQYAGVGPAPAFSEELARILGHGIGRNFHAEPIGKAKLIHERGPTPRLVALDGDDRIARLQAELDGQRRAHQAFVDRMKNSA